MSFIASLEARDWDVSAGLLHPAVVYEIRQSRERIRGRDRYLRFNQDYPGDWHLRPKVVITDEQHGVVWFEWRLDDRTDDAMAFFRFANGLITKVTDFWPEPYEPPSGREHLVERCDLEVFANRRELVSLWVDSRRCRSCRWRRAMRHYAA